MQFKNDILKLRSEGKTFSEIVKILGCSRQTVCYYFSETRKANSIRRNKIYRSRKSTLTKTNDKITSRIYRFSRPRTLPTPKTLLVSLNQSITSRIKSFSRNRQTKMLVKPTFKRKDLLEKIGTHPKCYLTGEQIDLSDNKSWCLDHIIPLSRGGSMNLDNANICMSKVNQSKHALLNDEFFELCKKVLEYNGYNVSLKEKVQGDGFQPPSSSDARCPIF